MAAAKDETSEPQQSLPSKEEGGQHTAGEPIPEQVNNDDGMDKADVKEILQTKTEQDAGAKPLPGDGDNVGEKGETEKSTRAPRGGEDGDEAMKQNNILKRGQDDGEMEQSLTDTQEALTIEDEKMSRDGEKETNHAGEGVVADSSFQKALTAQGGEGTGREQRAGQDRAASSSLVVSDDSRENEESTEEVAQHAMGDFMALLEMAADEMDREDEKHGEQAPTGADAELVKSLLPVQVSAQVLPFASFIAHRCERRALDVARHSCWSVHNDIALLRQCLSAMSSILVQCGIQGRGVEEEYEGLALPQPVRRKTIAEDRKGGQLSSTRWKDEARQRAMRRTSSLVVQMKVLQRSSLMQALLAARKDVSMIDPKELSKRISKEQLQELILLSRKLLLDVEKSTVDVSSSSSSSSSSLLPPPINLQALQPKAHEAHPSAVSSSEAASGGRSGRMEKFSSSQLWVVQRIGGNVLNVRTRPEVGSKKVGECREGDILEVEGIEGDWVKLSSDNDVFLPGQGGGGWVLHFHRRLRTVLLAPMLRKDAMANGKVLEDSSLKSHRSRLVAQEAEAPASLDPLNADHVSGRRTERIQRLPSELSSNVSFSRRKAMRLRAWEEEKLQEEKEKLRKQLEKELLREKRKQYNAITDAIRKKNEMRIRKEEPEQEKSEEQEELSRIEMEDSSRDACSNQLLEPSEFFQQKKRLMELRREQRQRRARQQELELIKVEEMKKKLELQEEMAKQQKQVLLPLPFMSLFPPAQPLHPPPLLRFLLLSSPVFYSCCDSSFSTSPHSCLYLAVAAAESGASGDKEAAAGAEGRREEANFGADEEA
eukprot:762425-Hanusia_phi.AAC.1